MQVKNYFLQFFLFFVLRLVAEPKLNSPEYLWRPVALVGAAWRLARLVFCSLWKLTWLPSGLPADPRTHRPKLFVHKYFFKGNFIGPDIPGFTVELSEAVCCWYGCIFPAVAGFAHILQGHLSWLPAVIFFWPKLSRSVSLYRMLYSERRGRLWTVWPGFLTE